VEGLREVGLGGDVRVRGALGVINFPRGKDEGFRRFSGKVILGPGLSVDGFLCMFSKILDQRSEGVEDWEWKMRRFLSFQSCHTINPGRSCQILFKSGILKTSEP
jgi:hypothetical protein